ncbi:hypothetical protein PoB_007444400 [Plakobranchus ocellatus]|uniref:Uncharacterized protein n=1 Tax=Plakobranchus ocellatus TaxID=259542 RepID=A0AAV4DVA1_9GAST|nr:hypothetical protein PoB_007444400 [Plakobranchus ocellatus]
MNDTLEALASGILLRKQYQVVMMGQVSDDKAAAVTQTLRAAWAAHNFAITLIYYTVQVDVADSKLTFAEEPPMAKLSEQFDQTVSPIQLCKDCAVRKLQTLQVHFRGLNSSIGEHTSTLTKALQDAWSKKNSEFAGSVLVDIHTVTEHPSDANDGDSESEKSATVLFSLNLMGGQIGVSDLDLYTPSDEDFKLIFQKYDLDVTILEAEDDDDDDSFPWYIPVGVILALFLIGLIIVVFLFITRDARRRDSRHMRQQAEGLVGFDKEHFAREPDIPNPTFAPDDAEFDDKKSSTYCVNPHQISGAVERHRETHDIDNNPEDYTADNFDHEHFTMEPLPVAYTNPAFRDAHLKELSVATMKTKRSRMAREKREEQREKGEQQNERMSQKRSKQDVTDRKTEL